MAMFAIDRFESDWAVLEAGPSETFRVPRAWLPRNAREGIVLRIDLRDAGESTLLTVAVDEAATAARMAEAEGKRSQLPRGPDGDLSL